MGNIIKKYKNNVRKIIISYASKIVAFVGFYLCDLILARGLGVVKYAEWALFFSIINIVLWLSNFGISLTIRTIAAREEVDERRKYFINCGLILRLFISLLFVILCWFVAKPLATAMGRDYNYPELQFLFKYGAFLPLFMAIVEYWKGIFVGIGNLNKLLAMAFFEHIGYAIGCSIGMLISRNVEGALLGYYIGYVVAAIMGMLMIRLDLSILKFDKLLTKDIVGVFKSGLGYIIPCLVAFVILEMDTVMLGWFSVEERQLSAYVVAKKIVQKAISVNEAFLYAMLPQFAIITIENLKEKNNSFRRVRNLNFFITFFVSVGIAGVLAWIIPTIYGEQYNLTRSYLIMLTPAYFLNAVMQCYMQFLYYREMADVVSKYYATSLFTNFVINCLLIPRIGAAGAAIGTVVSLIMPTFLMRRYVDKLWNTDSLIN